MQRVTFQSRDSPDSEGSIVRLTGLDNAKSCPVRGRVELVRAL
jgi:hypothetical protein